MQKQQPASRVETLVRLQRMVGVHKWTLNLQSKLIRIEYGRDFNDTSMFEVTSAQLREMLSKEDMFLCNQHWDEAVRQGYSGPVNMPFIKANGERTLVESVCALHEAGSENSLVGVFKRISETAQFGRNARLLTKFLESFIEHSPSSIVVVDQTGRVVSANREFIRFVGRGSRSEIVQRPVLDIIYEISQGLGVLMRDALRNPQPTRGRYELSNPNGTRETLYWRAFPLSLDEGFTPPKVFAFDQNEGGARILAM